MKRIVAVDGFFSPDIEDFKKLDTKIILTKLLIMYVLDDENEIRMLHYHQIHEIANYYDCGLELGDALLRLINDIPVKSWKVIEKHIAVKVKRS